MDKHIKWNKTGLFVDADGVLADFDWYASQLFGVKVHVAMPDSIIDRFWETIHEHPNFFDNLPPMPFAKYFMKRINHLNPTILTGVPKYLHETNWARNQKLKWASRHFPNTPILTCLSEYKSLHMKEGDIIIDDSIKFKHLWEQKGGIWVTHTSVKDTLKQLEELGVL